MSALAAPYPQPSIQPARLIAMLRSFEPRFFALGVLMLAAALPTAFASLVDGRQFPASMSGSSRSNSRWRW